MTSAIAEPHTARHRGLFRDVEDRRELLSAVSPNWFAAVMGTGIVANAAAGLPFRFPGLRPAGLVVWVVAALLLLVLLAMTAAHWARFPAAARGWLTHPTLAHFYGAPAMAFMTVGSGAMLVGRDLIGEPAAIAVDWTLWSIGTAIGLGSAWWVTFAMFTRRIPQTPDDAFGGWLMPIVPPMVSAASGALLLPTLPAGEGRLDLLLACYGMFGLTLLCTVPILTMVWARFLRHGVGAAAAVPTMWIVLGPLGQSVTAAGQLGDQAGTALGAPYSTALHAFAVVYGAPVLGFAMLWASLAIAVTVRTARAGLPFSLTWWSFTFPVGTCVTGATQLARHTGSAAVEWLVVVLFAGLVVAWVIAFARTFQGAVVSGALLAPRA